MAGSYTFYALIGEDFDRTLTWLTARLVDGGTPIPLTGFTASMTVGIEDNFITTTSSANGAITLGGSAGTIRLQIPKDVLATLPVGGTTYKLFLTNTEPETSGLLTGTIQMR